MNSISNTQQKVDPKKFGDNYDRIFRRRSDKENDRSENSDYLTDEDCEEIVRQLRGEA